MKIVVAMDSFKGSLSAAAACEAVCRGLQTFGSDVDALALPVADGGEGTAQAMLKAKGGEWVPKEVMGPLPDMRVDAGYAWFPEEEMALVEMARASGIVLVPEGRANPMKTTTYGTGELIASASSRGAKKILLAVGGSATVDGGTGAAQALGWRFCDPNGEDVGLGGESLQRIAILIPSEETDSPRLEVLCDVQNILTGREGAARVYGPQKGADSNMVAELEAGLSNLARVVREQLGVEIETVPGSGAAGGLSAGALAFMKGRLVSGIETVLDAIGLDEHLEGADWVVTGEGKFDRQSLYGKVVAGVADRAREKGIPVAVLAGIADIDPSSCEGMGVQHVLSLCGHGVDQSDAVNQAEKYLRERAVKLGEIIL